MDRREPALFPEWLKGASGSSSHSDEQSKHSNGILLRSRLLLNAANHDHGPLRSSMPSSYRRSVSSNGSTGHDRDGYSRSQAYSSFGRSRRDRDRDKDRGREADHLLDDGYHDYSDPIRSGRIERDPLRRSQSMVTGGRGPSAPKRPGSSLSNGAANSSAGIGVASFEKEFPSLGAEEKVTMPDVCRVNTPGIQSLSLGLSNGWTSALAEAPGRVGTNGPQVSSGLQTSSNMASVVLSTGTGLSMAEALAQAPSRVNTAPQLTNDSERKKELTQLGKLIPVVNKGQVHNSSDKLKSKGAKISDYNASKSGLQSSSQPVNHVLRLPVAKPDVPKVSQATNYQVLNWEKNSIDSTAKDGLTSKIASREAASLGGSVQSAPSPHPRSTINPKLKVNGTVGGEKNPLSPAKGRNDFFNGLRKQPMPRNSSAINLETNCIASSSSSSSASNLVVETIGEITGASASQENDIPTASTTNSGCPDMENGSNDACDEEPERLVPLDEEEAAFLRSLGWEENAGEEALTQEEIESFVSKHPCTKLKAVFPEPQQGEGCT
ncbi:uncharacterized protein M6B38_273885 [Iris pallida]|uniref:Uncharacterized protein n=1 Tax=Iris pallida TaxID=29817 RepID=A0AAX6I571_IRIPA|nr:Uncharacterized protein M6B38_211950 [Iris pallida]KAJ6848352.1 uncharacterized protein M6B38_273885 [Iris pallida]